MIRTVRAVLVACFVLLLATVCLGQGGVATGDLHVTVKDPSGNVVANATVTVQDAAKGVERIAVSDGQGGYSARLLPPGTYSVSVNVAGFTRVENTGVSVTVGALVELPVALTISTSKEVVEVTSQTELVETSRSSTTDTIGQRRIDNLPINGRNYINFTLTDSQIVRDNAPNTGAAPTSGLNMSGQRARSNLVNVDGADATDNSVNGVRSTVSQEAVQEFQIITNSYAAEYGRASGGVVNIITRSGSNAFHGDVFGYPARPESSGGESVQHGSQSCLYARAGRRGVWRGDQERQNIFLLRLRDHAAARDGIFCDRTGLHDQRWPNCFGLSPFDASAYFGAPAGIRESATHSRSDFIPEQSSRCDATAAQQSGLRGRSRTVCCTGWRFIGDGGEWRMAACGLTGGIPGHRRIPHKLHCAAVFCSGVLSDAGRRRPETSRYSKAPVFIRCASITTSTPTTA